MGRPTNVGEIAAALRARAANGTLVVGVTGPVAVGKSWLAAALAAEIAGAVAVSTDGFLLANAELAARGLTMRKGFPESYDADAMRAFVAAARVGHAWAPGYSHSAYDVDADAGTAVERPAVLLLEGLGLADAGVDVLLYLDAAEAEVRRWFEARLLAAWRAGRGEPGAFYARFPDEAAVAALAEAAWGGINLPNWREHIAPMRSRADMVVEKDAAHRLFAVRGL